MNKKNITKYANSLIISGIILHKKAPVITKHKTPYSCTYLNRVPKVADSFFNISMESNLASYVQVSRPAPTNDTIIFDYTGTVVGWMMGNPCSRLLSGSGQSRTFITTVQTTILLNYYTLRCVGSGLILD